MEDVIKFNRLLSAVVTSLGPNFTSDLAKLAVIVMTFVEKEAEDFVLSSAEKLTVFETYLNRLVSSTQLGSLEASTVALVKSFVTQICKASKGQLNINTTSASVQPAPVETPVKTNSLGRKKGLFKH